MSAIFSSVTAALPAPGHAEITAALTAEPTQAEHDRIARGVTALTAIEYRAPDKTAAPRRPLRLGAWNAERLKYGAASAALLGFDAQRVRHVLHLLRQYGPESFGDQGTIVLPRRRCRDVLCVRRAGRHQGG